MPKSKILIADDDPIARESLNTLLFKGDYELEFAADGREALDKALSWLPDLVLLDGMMPWLDGFTVCRQLRQHPQTAEVPILIITALDDHDSHLEGIEAGADDFISKPFNRAILRARIHTIVRLNRYRHLVTERTKFERVVNQANSGFLLINEQDQILFANPMASHYLGLVTDAYQPGKVSFRQIAESQYHCQPEAGWDNWPQSASPSDTRYLVRPESSTARDFWLQVDILDSFDTTEEATYIIGLTNVTAQMSSFRDISHFHALMSHKLRTPLTSIVCGLELLSNNKLPAEQAPRLIQLARDGTARLQNDINQVIKYLTAPGLSAGADGCSIEMFLDLFRQLSEEMDIQITVEPDLVDTDLNSHMRLTCQVAEIVLREVLGNAQKFHPENKPTIELALTTLGAEEIQIQIRDNGRHLSPEQLAQVWQPYYQGDKYFTGEVPGMGLGLAMVAAFVWGVGGQCHLYNRSATPGITVELVLPLQVEPVSS